MCGILGLAAREPVPPDRLDAVELMRHRGPDSDGRYVSGRIGLAIRRLAIIDLDTGDQPVANEAGDVVCVLNGEIYNYRELRAELAASGHTFRSQGDVEVLPHLYEQHGAACFERLRGMFAAALWDEGRARLLLARDRFGIKPLYLADTPAGLAFASEVKPLLALGAPVRPDLQALADYLTLGYTPGEATGLEGVRSLEPGTVLTWEAGRVRESPYWSFEPGGEGGLEETLAEAVRLHLRADVPIAVLLSGGLDSSLVASLAAAALDEPLRTFTVGFGDLGFDEREYARAVAAAVGSDHHELTVRPDAAAELPTIVERLEEPLADPSAIPLYAICRAVGAEVKVALAGDSGDELFGGYSRYVWDPIAGRLGRLLPAGAIGRLLERVPGLADRSGRKDLGRRTLKLLRHAELPEAERYLAWFALFSEEAKADILREGQRPAGRVFEQHLARAPSGVSGLGRLQYVDLRTMLADDLLLKADKMSMAHSLELRVPLLDHEVARLGLFLPDREKVRGVETKRAIRRLVARRLPSEIARRPKQGFEVPIARWLREDLAEMAGDLLAPQRIARRGLLDAETVGRLLRAHLAGERDHGLRLYALLVLELWFEQIVDRTPRPARASR